MNQAQVSRVFDKLSQSGYSRELLMGLAIIGVLYTVEPEQNHTFEDILKLAEVDKSLAEPYRKAFNEIFEQPTQNKNT